MKKEIEIDVLNELIKEGCYSYFRDGVEINGMLIPLKNNEIDTNTLSKCKKIHLLNYYKSIKKYLD